MKQMLARRSGRPGAAQPGRTPGARRDPGPAHASPATLLFWSSLFTTMRPYLAFVSGAAALVGLAFAELSPLRMAAAFLPLFLSYGFGQALTDCFQTDTDALSSPYRPLVRGVLSRAQVLAVSFGGLTTGAGILAWLNPHILLPAALAVAGLALYTPLKRTWWGGPPWNASVVALVPMMARMAAGGSMAGALTGPHARSVAGAVVAVFLGYADFVVTGYLKDVSADRATGYRTFPVVFGWRATAVYGDLVALGSAAAAALVLASGGAGALAWTVFLASAGVALRAHVAVHRLRDERAAHGPIADVVRVFLLTCIAMVLSLRVSWSPTLAVFYVLFELTLRRRPERTQV